MGSGDSKISVVAIIAVRNEDDVIAHVVRALIEQEVQVYVLDDGSTDDTRRLLEPWVGRGVVAIEDLQETFQEPRHTFQWGRILERKAQVAFELNADWFIHHDADEFRESPWEGRSLAEAIGHVDALGFNAIDFVCLNFRPIDDSFVPGQDVRLAITHCEPPAPHDRTQIRCWKKDTQRVDLTSTGGHEARFDNRRVFPTRFLLRHYPIRTQAQGKRKIFCERLPRHVPEERAREWHVQYDHLTPGQSLLGDPTHLVQYDGSAIRVALAMVQDGDGSIHDELMAIRRDKTQLAEALVVSDARRREMAAQVDALGATLALTETALEHERANRTAAELQARDLTATIASVAGANEMLQHELKQVQGDAQRSAADLSQALHTQAVDAERAWSEVRALRDSASWRVTAPLRWVYGLFLRGGTTSPDDR